MWLLVRNNLNNWLALHRVPGIGPIKFKQCLLENPELTNLPKWVKPNWKLVNKDLYWQQQKDCYILTLNDKRYPSLLKQIPNPPPVLFVRGRLELLQNLQIAIVGSRSPSSQGIELAYNFGSMNY